MNILGESVVVINISKLIDHHSLDLVARVPAPFDRR